MTFIAAKIDDSLVYAGSRCFQYYLNKGAESESAEDYHHHPASCNPGGSRSEHGADLRTWAARQLKLRCSEAGLHVMLFSTRVGGR